MKKTLCLMLVAVGLVLGDVAIGDAGGMGKGPVVSGSIVIGSPGYAARPYPYSTFYYKPYYRPYWSPYVYKPYYYAYPGPYFKPYVPAYPYSGVVVAPPVYVPPSQVYVQPAPPAYAEQAPQQPQSYWYYCRDPEGYYPHVAQCPGGWMTVLPTPQGQQ